MRPSGKQPGFSLIEVIIAVGIFAASVTVILALLPGLTRQAADATDTLTAQRLPDAVQLELERLSASGGFDGLRTTVPALNTSVADGLAMVASRDGARLHSMAYLPPVSTAVIPQGEQYFAIELWQFTSGQLAHDSNTVLPVLVRVSWPYWSPGTAVATPLANRQQLTFTIALKR